MGGVQGGKTEKENIRKEKSKNSKKEGMNKRIKVWEVGRKEQMEE